MNDKQHSAPPQIAVGIAGWSYPDWKGYVYHPGVRDQLRFIAGYFDVVEINSTFYRPPEEAMSGRWAERTADLENFRFTAKLHQDITHKGRIEQPMVEMIRNGFEPLRAAGKLSHLLAQFRYDYSDSEAHREHLRRIWESFGDLCTLTFELRHNTWQSPRALEYLDSLGVSVANLDYPTARDSFTMRECTVGSDAYLRLHGRNYDAWFSKSGRDQTYNYLYDEKELDGITARATRIAKLSKSLTLIANNHYQGKEAVNALELRARLSGQKVPVPPQLLKRYPRLESITA